MYIRSTTTHSVGPRKFGLGPDVNHLAVVRVSRAGTNSTRTTNGLSTFLNTLGTQLFETFYESTRARKKKKEEMCRRRYVWTRPVTHTDIAFSARVFRNAITDRTATFDWRCSTCISRENESRERSEKTPRNAPIPENGDYGFPKKKKKTTVSSMKVTLSAEEGAHARRKKR